MVILMTGNQVVVAVMVSLFLAIVGLLCLFWPEAVRTYAVKTSSNRFAQQFNPFVDWMKTPGYIWSLRIIGALALCGVGLIATSLIRGAK